FNGLEAKNLPFGQYEYVLNRTDIAQPRLSTIRGRLYVSRPEHWLELNPSGIYESSNGDEVIQEFDEQQDVPVIGTLVPAPEPQVSVWVRIEALHSRDRVAAGVNARGEFRIYDRLWGWYVVMVLKDGKLVHTEPLYVEDPKKLKTLFI